jgi:hypothetical protein
MASGTGVYCGRVMCGGGLRQQAAECRCAVSLMINQHIMSSCYCARLPVCMLQLQAVAPVADLPETSVDPLLVCVCAAVSLQAVTLSCHIHPRQQVLATVQRANRCPACANQLW